MHPLVKETQEQYIALYQRFQEIFDMGDELMFCDNEEIESLLDQRLRMLNYSETESKTCSQLVAAIRSMDEIPASEKALIEEIRSRIIDLAPRVVHQSKTLIQNMESRLSQVKSQMLLQSKTTRAVSCYIKAPAARNLIY